MDISTLLSQYLSDHDNGKNKLIQLRQAITEALNDEQDYASTVPEWKPVRLLMRDDKVGGGYYGDSNKPIHDLSQCMAYIKDQNERISDQVNAGFILVSSFEQGATLTLSNEVLLFEQDGQYYRWTGDLPKVVDVNSTPDSTGGIGGSKWVLVGDGALRSQIIAPTGAGIVGEVISFDALRYIVPPRDGYKVKLRSWWAGNITGGGEFVGYLSNKQDDGGVIASSNNGFYWQRVILDEEQVSLLDFGGQPSGGFMGVTFGDLPALPRYDNTESFKKAVDYCIANRKRLFIPAGCFYFENENIQIDINGSIEIVGSGFNTTQFAVNFSLASDPKKAKFLSVSNNRLGFSNFQIRSGSYLGIPLSFNRSVGDNQKFNLDKVWIDSCRYGLYVDEAECINQIEIKNCVFQSNYYWGIYIKSFDSGWGHSAPVHFINTISNGNGVPSWVISSNAVYTSPEGTEITIKDSDYDVGGQLFLKGLSNVQYIGGQLSGHSSPRTQGLAVLNNINSFGFYGTDIEDIEEGSAYTADGKIAITKDNLDLIEKSYKNDLSGAALVINSVTNFKIDNCHIYSVKTLATIKLLFATTYNSSIGNISTNQALRYDVWNANPAAASYFIHPFIISGINGIDGGCYEKLGYTPSGEVIIHNEKTQNTALTPSSGNNVPHSLNLWQNGKMFNATTDLNTGWLLTYLEKPTDELNENHLFNEFVFNKATVTDNLNTIRLNNIYISTIWGAEYNAGRFIIQSLDTDNNVLNAQWFKPNEFNTSYPAGGTVRFQPASNATKIRYGFVNSGNYQGTLKNHFCGQAINDKFFLRVVAIVDKKISIGAIGSNFTACKD